jgi:hypothetical protein
MTKAMTLRLDEAQAKELEAVARIDEVPVAEAVREAITTHIAARRRDHAFQERLARRMDQDREILEQLAQQ